jgi:hypothetical protein
MLREAREFYILCSRIDVALPELAGLIFRMK